MYCQRRKPGITVLTGKCEVTVDNIFNWMDWKKVLLKDIGEFRDVLEKTQPGVVDLVGSINKRANETQFIGVRCKTKVLI